MRVFLHLASLFLPVATLAYLVTGPHPWWVSVLSTSIVGVPLVLDAWMPVERRMHPLGPPAWAFDALLFVLAILHVTCVAALSWHVARTGLSVDAFVATWLVGNASAQGIVLSHELIHRRATKFRLTGRLLLASVLYEHFYTEHLRGHHRLVGTDEDPASARYGERFLPFLRRTLPAQFASAWSLECKRVGTTHVFDVAQRHNRVLHGLLAGASIAVGLTSFFGPGALLAHVGQAAVAVVMLESVNFIEHWGLRRTTKRVRVVDSWDSEGALTYYMLIGLARHGDHHAHAARPWQELRSFDDTPKMPWGYLATAYCAIFADFILLPRLDAELRAKGLGPYASEPLG